LRLPLRLFLRFLPFLPFPPFPPFPRLRAQASRLKLTAPLSDIP
jgi:hypothetical protein